MGRIEDRIRAGESLEHFEQIALPGIMEVNPRLFEQQDAALVLAPTRMGKLPRERDMPPEAARSAVQTHRHADRFILGEDIQGRPVDLNVEFNFLLTPKVAELFAEVR